MHRFSSILIQTSEAIEIINWISTVGRYSSLLSIFCYAWIWSSHSCCVLLEFTHIPSWSKTTLCLILRRDHFKDKLTLNVIATNWYLWVISRLCSRIDCFIASLNPGPGHRVSLPAVSKQSPSRNKLYQALKELAFCLASISGYQQVSSLCV